MNTLLSLASELLRAYARQTLCGRVTLTTPSSCSALQLVQRGDGWSLSRKEEEGGSWITCRRWDIRPSTGQLCQALSSIPGLIPSPGDFPNLSSIANSLSTMTGGSSGRVATATEIRSRSASAQATIDSMAYAIQSRFSLKQLFPYYPIQGESSMSSLCMAAPSGAKIRKLKSRKGKHSKTMYAPIPSPPPEYEEVEVPLVIKNLQINKSEHGFQAKQTHAPNDDRGGPYYNFSTKADLMAFLEEVLPDGE